MHIWLLTHPEELKKENGTGKLVLNTHTEHTTCLVWERTKQPAELLHLPQHSTYLIYPKTEQEKANEQSLDPNDRRVENIIILDGTWQQTRKMYNRSPYLHRFLKYEIYGETSIFKRRRNQVKNGLCTAETAAHLLKIFGEPLSGEQIHQAFLAFNEKTLDNS